MSQPSVYNLRLAAPGAYAMAKFSMPDFNLEAVYNLTPKGRGYSCDCPAGARSVKLRPCKHQRMLPFMLGAVNTERFYEPESGNWSEPLRLMRNGDMDGLSMTPELELLDRPLGISNGQAQATGVVQPTHPSPPQPPAETPPPQWPQAQAQGASMSARPSAPTPMVRRI